MLEPLVPSPPHFSDSDGRFCFWLTEPLGLVTFVGQSHGPSDFVDYLRGTVTPQLMKLHAESPRRMLFVHDWRNIETFDVGLRKRLIDWGMKEVTPPNIKEVVILLRKDTPALLKMASQAGVAIIRATYGVQMRVEHSANTLVRDLDLRARPPL